MAEDLSAACLVTVVATVAICANAVWSSPPRFDGAGYSLLARACLAGEGYRAVDHPDRPRHAHFPPGYPLALALVWSITGISARAAHIASVVFTTGACLAAWRWFRFLMPAPVALALGLALAVNWLWARTGSAIQSEPLYMLLGQLTILAAARAGRPRSRASDTIALTLLLAGSLLTRHIAVGLALAIFIDLVARGRRSQAVTIAAVTTLLIAPWLGWMIAVGRSAATQPGMLVTGGWPLVGTITRQAVFYVERMPDQITGPFVEYGTASRSGAAMTGLRIWAACASMVVVAGWARLMRRQRRRLAGLVPFLTLGVLVLWPFTEAGRFLIPLVPFILLGAVEGIVVLGGWLCRQIGVRLWPSRMRMKAAWLVLAVSMPYSAYMLATGRTRAQELTHRDFDAACEWLATNADRPGPVLSRHPGEVFWRTGRQGLEVATTERPGAADAGPDAISRIIATYRVAYVLVDRERYAGAPSSPLSQFVTEHPEQVRAAWERGSVAIYEVIRPYESK
jgi:hypothetical protein